ncbi:MAG: ligase-associated DNA damage response exonuclease [Pirellulales bacterium]|nr:ligase-associated DNA damage response exonuclease [Pirellulales bacterium]
MDLLTVTDRGLYCAAGDFFIDPWRPVSRAVITHAHADHARAGMGRYVCAAPGVGVLQTRVGRDAVIQGVPYGQTLTIGPVKITLFPAGHVLGSAQVRVEHRGMVWVASGDYKTAIDPTCATFEPVRCQVFITESTFGLPIYRWQPPERIFDQINQWWAENQAEGRTSVLFGYSLGKAQRLLAGVDASLGPILVHSAIMPLVEQYRLQGVRLPLVEQITTDLAKQHQGRALVVAPPAADVDSWLRKFGESSTAAASGWMQIRGARRRQTHDRGFVLSDHADWEGLISSIRATGAERVLVTHGYTATLTRYLNECGIPAQVLPLRGFAATAEDAALEGAAVESTADLSNVD